MATGTGWAPTGTAPKVMVSLEASFNLHGHGDGHRRTFYKVAPRPRPEAGIATGTGRAPTGTAPKVMVSLEASFNLHGHGDGHRRARTLGTFCKVAPRPRA